MISEKLSRHSPPGDCENAEVEEDHFILHESKRIKLCMSPRLIILTKAGDFPLVRYRDTKWFGLPGGKAKKSEVVESGNFLSHGAFPTLSREVEEECGLDVSDFLKTSCCCLGLVEIGAVKTPIREVTMSHTPIFVCTVPDLKNLKEGARVVNIRSHLPGPLFPDARMGITRLKEVLKTTPRGSIYPEFLNTNKRVCYVEFRPQVKPLMGPPEWMY